MIISGSDHVENKSDYCVHICINELLQGGEMKFDLNGLNNSGVETPLI